MYVYCILQIIRGGKVLQFCGLIDNHMAWWCETTMQSCNFKCLPLNYSWVSWPQICGMCLLWEYVCVFAGACKCACVRVCMYVYVYTCVCVCVHGQVLMFYIIVCELIWEHTYVVSIQMYVCVSEGVCVCVHVCMTLCVFVIGVILIIQCDYM